MDPVQSTVLSITKVILLKVKPKHTITLIKIHQQLSIMTKPKFLTTANRAPSDLSLDHLQTADPFPYPWKLPLTPPLRAHVPKCSDVRPSASPTADLSWPALCASIPDVFLCVLITSSYEDTSRIGLGATLMASFYFNHLFKGLISNTVTF